MVTHVFWPVNVIGAMRSLRVVGELIRQDYEPTVLTLGHWDRSLEDYEYGAAIGARVRITKVRLFKIVLWLCTAVNALRARRSRGLRTFVSLLLVRVLDFLIRLLDAPLCEIGILMHGIWLGRGQRPDCIYCSVPTYPTLIGSALLAKCLRVPLVADFRDLWTLHEYAELRHPSKLGAWLADLAERFVLSSAAYVIYNTDIAKDMMDVKYPAYKDKTVVITNGTLLDDSELTASPDYDRPFTIAHVGSLYLGRRPDDFLEALQEWMTHRGKEVCGRVAVRLVGQGSEYVVKRLDTDGLDVDIEAYPQKSKAELAAILMESHLLLLCLGYRDNSRYVMPAKMYDYLAAERPIIAYVPRDGEVARLMKEIGLEDNVVVEPDSRRTGDILDREFDRYLCRDGTFSVPQEIRRRYDYSVIAGKIEQVIARAMDSR